MNRKTIVIASGLVATLLLGGCKTTFEEGKPVDTRPCYDKANELFGQELANLSRTDRASLAVKVIWTCEGAGQ